MAQRVTTEYIDDIDGGAAVGTTTFAIDGQRYEIDLSERNRAELEKALEPFLHAARRADGQRQASLKPTPRRRDPQLARRAQLAQVRTWARANGHSVSERGRVPQALLEAYEAARERAYTAGQS